MREYIIRNNTPSARWEDSYPVGNGRMGATVMGYVDEEVLFLNEETVWSSQGKGIPNPNMADKLKAIRDLFIEGREAEGDKLAKEIFGDCHSRIRSYETAGKLKVSLHDNGKCKNYINNLDLMRGVAKVEYDKDGSHYVRECFASYPDDVIAYRVTSDKASLSACISYEREMLLDVKSDGAELCAVAKTVFGNHKFAVRARVYTDGKIDCRDGDIYVSDTQSFTLLISISTEFRNGESFADAIKFPENDDYDMLKLRHEKDFLSLMSSADIQFPEVEELETVTNPERRRILDFNKPSDGKLVSMQWHFGRYIIASSSRPGSLPANLQGLWVKSLGNEWSADYHTNINIQANYWPAEVTNLSDCHKPLFDYMNEYLLESGKETAKIGYKARGTVVHHLSDIYKFTTPADGLWGIWPHGASWLSYHMWEHYLFTQDKEFLKNEAYEFIRDSAIFFVDTMIENKDGYLVYGPSTSPENRYWVKDENGEDYACYLTLSSTMDVGIIGGLFRNFLQASEVLGIEDEYVKEIRKAQKKLPPFKISASGRIQEWIEDYEETEKGHFHISHSFAHFPDCAINHSTPELLEAMKKTIYGRLNGGNNAQGYSALTVGWSIGWMMNHLARFRHGDGAYELIQNYLNLTNPRNLWDLHAKCWQIDGNCSFVAGVSEMLIQSHEGYIALLPALPKQWDHGSFRGLRVRGGAELDIKWESYEVREICFTPDIEGKFIIKLPENQKTTTFKGNDGNTYTAVDGKIELNKRIQLIAE
ncbi:MAG: glycoside hydrolase family 95 protein [Oscillospiraceae bacterium]|nr:glycoside hydrolase family 95 protein [Oscillospiraceae bacterium]